MSHISYSHLYYFWHVCRESPVIGAAEAFRLAPQTTAGQTRTLEERLQGKLFRRKGHGLKPSELGELVYRYADRMFTLSQEMLNIVDYRKESSSLFDIGVVDALSKRLVSSVLSAVVVEGEPTHLCRFESTHEVLLEQLSQHKPDIIISDYPINSMQQEGLFSAKIGECGVSFWCANPPPGEPFPACPEERRLLIPGRRPIPGRKLLNQFSSQGLNVEVLDEFDDAALMEAFGVMHNAIFAAPTLYAYGFYTDKIVVEVGRVENVVEEYHAISAKRMIQHLVVRRICNTDYSALFSPAVR